VNLSSSGDYKRTMDAINNIEVDLLMFQEVTPDWDMVLKETLSEEYPFTHTVLRIDPYGLACYSKHPLEDIDTFHFSEIPNLYAEIRVGQEYSVNLLSAHTVPPVNSKAYESIREHFDVITGYMKDCSGPSLVMGDFNLPSWAQEIKEFKYIANLNDSRRDIMPTSLQGNISIFNIPVDHIFYSGQLDCTDFQVIEDVSGNHLGIKGTYQFISNQEVPISSGD
jgi:endonuclease/exonuclease/phosphatase (EEP) superfamily protein YafD